MAAALPPGLPSLLVCYMPLAFAAAVVPLCGRSNPAWQRATTVSTPVRTALQACAPREAAHCLQAERSFKAPNALHACATRETAH